MPTTPAQIFHLLRRQMVRPFRKPLIVMTPKSLLRKREAVSPPEGAREGRLPDGDRRDRRARAEGGDARRRVLRQGVLRPRSSRGASGGIDDVAIVRVEQLYPFPHKQFAAEMKRYPNAHEVVWCQEEPQNQGAWYQTQHYFVENMRPDQRLFYAGRPSAASPAVGYLARHNEQQKALVEQAFGKFRGYAAGAPHAEYCAIEAAQRAASRDAGSRRREPAGLRRDTRSSFCSTPRRA